MVDGFIDSYKMRWLLEDENGLMWVEEFDDVSLSDIEEIYGKNIHQVIRFEMRLKHAEMDNSHSFDEREWESGQVFWGL